MAVVIVRTTWNFQCYIIKLYISDLKKNVVHCMLYVILETLFQIFVEQHKTYICYIYSKIGENVINISFIATKCILMSIVNNKNKILQSNT